MNKKLIAMSIIFVLLSFVLTSCDNTKNITGESYKNLQKNKYIKSFEMVDLENNEKIILDFNSNSAIFQECSKLDKLGNGRCKIVDKRQFKKEDFEVLSKTISPLLNNVNQKKPTSNYFIQVNGYYLDFKPNVINGFLDNYDDPTIFADSGSGGTKDCKSDGCSNCVYTDDGETESCSCNSGDGSCSTRGFFGKIWWHINSPIGWFITGLITAIIILGFPNRNND